MVKTTNIKKEAKEVLAISLFFFFCFTVFAVLKKLILSEHDIEYYGFIPVVIGSIVLGKVVLIFDKLRITKWLDHMANIYRVGFRSFIYLLGYILFTFLEYGVMGLFKGEGIIESFTHNVENLTSKHGLAALIILFISFIIFNAFWMIRAYVGPGKLYRLFFEK